MVLPTHSGRIGRGGWSGGEPEHPSHSGTGSAGRPHSAGSGADPLHEELSGSIQFAGEALLEAQTAGPALGGLARISGQANEEGAIAAGSFDSGNRSPLVKPLSRGGSMLGLDDSVLLETVEETEEAATARSGNLHLGEGRRQSRASDAHAPAQQARVRTHGGEVTEIAAALASGLEMPSIVLEEPSEHASDGGENTTARAAVEPDAATGHTNGDDARAAADGSKDHGSAESQSSAQSQARKPTDDA
jgi:hypothetical protein